MFITTSGIVLRTYPFRDKKLIVKIFTKDFGLISCIITKNKSQIALSELLTIAEITYKNSGNQSLFYIKDVQVEHVYKSLTIHEKKIKTSIILCEILNKCLNEKNDLLYDFITTAFKYLDQTKTYIGGFDTLFLVSFCKVVGISPFDSYKNKPRNTMLNINDGQFVESNGAPKNNLIVPEKESYELCRLSRLSFSSLEDKPIECGLNKKLFNYMILYISTHLIDLTKLKSLEIFRELA